MPVSGFRDVLYHLTSLLYTMTVYEDLLWIGRIGGPDTENRREDTDCNSFPDRAWRTPLRAPVVLFQKYQFISIMVIGVQCINRP